MRAEDGEGGERESEGEIGERHASNLIRTAFDAAEINLPRVQIHLYTGKGPVSVEGM
jgi:hypothetical protein